jgi:hypothetical protein
MLHGTHLGGLLFNFQINMKANIFPFPLQSNHNGGSAPDLAIGQADYPTQRFPSSRFEVITGIDRFKRCTFCLFQEQYFERCKTLQKRNLLESTSMLEVNTVRDEKESIHYAY